MGASVKPRLLRTVYLLAPPADWAALSQGYKQEFRTSLKEDIVSRWIEAPTPVVLYSAPKSGPRREKLMVLTEHRTEILMDIADQPDSIMREGFESYNHFKRYWRARTKKPYDARRRVEVFRIAPWLPTDRERLGPLLIDRLYGEYL